MTENWCAAISYGDPWRSWVLLIPLPFGLRPFSSSPAPPSSQTHISICFIILTYIHRCASAEYTPYLSINRKHAIPPVRQRATHKTTAKDVMASENTSIGLLAQLPREVGNLIWEYFIPCHGQQTNLGILQTSHQLYEEVSPLVYQNEVLRFHISPTCQYQSWLSIMTRKNVKLNLCDLQDATSQGLLSLPYTKLKGINVELEAPDATDPGQMICLWKKVISLTDMLLEVNGLPDVEIHLVDLEPLKSSEESK